MEKLKEYAASRYPSRFKNKEIEILEEDNFFKVYTKDVSPVFLSKNILNKL